MVPFSLPFALHDLCCWFPERHFSCTDAMMNWWVKASGVSHVLSLDSLYQGFGYEYWWIWYPSKQKSTKPYITSSTGKKNGANFFRFKESPKQLSDSVWLIVGSPGPDDPKKTNPKMQQNPCPINWRQRHFDSGCLSNHCRFKTDWTCNCLNKKT